MTRYRDRMLAGEYDANNPNRDTAGTTTSEDLEGTSTPRKAKAQVKRSTTRSRTRRSSK